MAKIKHSAATRRRKKRVLKKAKGFWGDRSKQFQQARRALMHAEVYATRDRKVKKREFRHLWVARINAGKTMQMKDGRQAQMYVVFAYWFVGKGRTTPYHWQRIWWTTVDRVLHGRNQRWAYFLFDIVGIIT